MKVVTMSRPVCDQCKTTIMSPDDGFVFQGNVYVANAEPCGGVIGNNFPAKPGEDKAFSLAEVGLSCFCKTCLCDILKIDEFHITKD